MQTFINNASFAPCGKGGTRSTPGTLQHLQNPNGPPGGLKWPMRSEYGSKPSFLGDENNFCLNLFFNTSRHSKRKIVDKEKKNKTKRKE